ncbi:MAG TPA: HAD-IA family hydrolase, partial [Longimicrobiales bacterium]
SANREELDALLNRAGVRDLVQDATSASDIESSKPAPDAVQAALDAAGCRPDQAIMIGDTPYDIEAAQRAGVPSIALRCGGWADRDLQGAAAIYADPADLLAHYETSPLVDGMGDSAPAV